MNGANVESTKESSHMDHDFMSFDYGDLGLHYDADEGDYGHNLSSFVAVWDDAMNTVVQARIETIVFVEKNSGGRISKLSVHWYESHRSFPWLDAK